jgi:FtsH-binding integral membrane protein
LQDTLKKLFAKYSSLLFLSYIFLWLVFAIAFDLNKLNIPNTPINVHGLLLTCVTILILSRYIKKVWVFDRSRSIPNLTANGILMSTIAESVFQLIRQASISEDSFQDHVFNFFTSVIGAGILCACFSFLIAFYIKTKDVKLLLICILLFFVLGGIALRMLPPSLD